MSLKWDWEISLGNIITVGGMAVIAAGFAISFYYKANSTAETVAEMKAEIKQMSEDVRFLDKSVADNDKNMRSLVEGQAGAIKQEINYLRTDVVKIATEQDGHQRQIDDMKDDIRDLDAQ